jgi:hypothetical protein
MPELTPLDVQYYTGGLLSADNPQTQRMLDVALAAARGDVRWYVSPVQYAAVITLNGTGTNKLRLPTKQVINIDSITNDGVALDPDTDVTLDCETPNLLYINSGRWSNQLNGIVITMDHGFPEDTAAAALIDGYTGEIAADWRQAILALVASVSQIEATGRADAELDTKQIDDVVYRWGAMQGLVAIEPTLARYRLLYKWV